MFKNFINIITAPQAAFDSIKEKPSVLFPLFIVIIFLASVQLLYFANVDVDFLIEQLVEQVMSLGLPVQEGELRASYENMNPMTQGITAAVSIAIVYPIIYSIYAGYLTFISKFSSDGIKFKAWFSLLSWTSVVTIFSSLAAMVVIFMSADGMINLEQLKPLSLNNLLFQTDGSFKTLLSNLDISQLWVLALLTLGYKSWTGKSITASFLVVAAPFYLIYGIWALIILL